MPPSRASFSFKFSSLFFYVSLTLSTHSLNLHLLSQLFSLVTLTWCSLCVHSFVTLYSLCSLCLSLPLSLSHSHTHTHTHRFTLTRAHTLQNLNKEWSSEFDSFLSFCESNTFSSLSLSLFLTPSISPSFLLSLSLPPFLFLLLSLSHPLSFASWILNCYWLICH